MVKRKCKIFHFEVEVTPTGCTAGKKERILLSPKAYKFYTSNAGTKFSPYSKIKKIRKICDIRKWRGH